MIKTIFKSLYIFLGIIAGLVVLYLVAMSIANSPTYTWRVLRYGQSDTQDYKIFPERPVENGPIPSFLPRGHQGTPYEVEYSCNRTTCKEKLDDLLKSTNTKAFLIVKDDQLLYETYLNSSEKEINTSFSSAKSVNSALISAAIADGYIDSVEDPVIKYIPEIAGRGLDTLTIRDLLLMNSGIHYVEGGELPFYLAPFADDVVTYYSTDMRKAALHVQASGAPIGEAFHYNNWHPLLEGVIIERATGMHVAEYLQERFWKPMGAEFPASGSLDSEASGFEKMEKRDQCPGQGFCPLRFDLPPQWILEWHSNPARGLGPRVDSAPASRSAYLGDHA